MNCSIASPGLIPKITCCMSLWVFPTEKNVSMLSLVHFGDNPDIKMRLSSTGPSTTGSDMEGLTSVTCIRLPSKVSPSFCATRLAATRNGKQNEVNMVALYCVSDLELRSQIMYTLQVYA